MNISLLLNTLCHLKVQQIYYQIKYRLVKKIYKNYTYSKEVHSINLTPFISKYKCFTENHFTFLNKKSLFLSWNDTSNGMLWTYNLNYMDWILQDDITFKDAEDWIDKFITELPQNKIGLDSYPIALRGINWIKFMSLHNDLIDNNKKKLWNDSLYSQYKQLENNLEYHLLGNHLLENAFSLYIASIYFNDVRLYKKANKLLSNELKEQLLIDGAHYEQSPMYHCILLDRLLDCYNFSFNNIRFKNQSKDLMFLKSCSIRMLGHLESILYKDGSYPLFNDSALGIAPKPLHLFDYANRLGLQWEPIPLKDSGYRKMINHEMEAFVDIGNIVATYQPGHSHADTFNFELRIKEKAFIVDTGISTYNKTRRRLFERSTSAHNTVTIANRNSSDVWSGFRVGKRALVKILNDDENLVRAKHDGFGKKLTHTRTFSIDANGFKIIDEVNTDKEVLSYIHLAPNVEVLSITKNQIETTQAVIKVEGADCIVLINDNVSMEYNKLQPVSVIKVYFKNYMSYNIVKL